MKRDFFLLVNREQGGNVEILAKKLSSFETFHLEFDKEVDVRFLRSEVLDKVVRCLHRTARCEQVVVDEHNVIGVDGIGVNLDGVVTVFFEVSRFARFGRKLTGLACHDESGSQFRRASRR